MGSSWLDFDTTKYTRSQLVQWLLDCEIIRHGQGVEYMQDSEVEQIAKESLLWDILLIIQKI